MAALWFIRNKLQQRIERLATHEYLCEQPVTDIGAWFSPCYVAPQTVADGCFRPFAVGTVWGVDGGPTSACAFPYQSNFPDTRSVWSCIPEAKACVSDTVNRGREWIGLIQRSC